VSIAYLLRRTPHVDIDDLGTAIHIETRGIRHLSRIGTDNLNRARLALATVVAAAATLRSVTQAPIAGDHFGHGQSCAEPSAQTPERTIGYTRHRCNKQRVCKRIAPDSHCCDALGPLTVGLMLKEGKLLPRTRIVYPLTAKGKREKQKLSLCLATCTATRLLQSHIEGGLRRAKVFKDLARNAAIKIEIRN
jgi:hypothetical protein